MTAIERTDVAGAYRVRRSVLRPPNSSALAAHEIRAYTIASNTADQKKPPT